MTSTTPLLKKIGLASFIMMASVFSSRIIGLFREMAIAWAGGAGGGVDAYQVAFIIPEILNHVVASGFLSITFIPIVSGYMARKDPAGAWRILSTILTAVGAVLLVFTALAFMLAPRLVSLLAPGLTDPQLTAQAVRMTRIIMPAQFFFFCGGLFMAVQFARERFLIPALAPLIYNLGIILGGLLLAPRMGMEGFAWGVLAGAVTGNFFIQYLGARRSGMRLSFSLNIFHPDFIRYILLTLPLMVGLTMTFSTEILLKFFGSFLPDGRIAALNYALRVMFILVGLFGQAVGVASYPFMAKLAARKEMDTLNTILNTTLRFLILVLPVSVLFMVLRREIVFLLFQRGAFDAAATQLTAQILPFLVAGTVAFAAQTVVVRGFYAIQNTWTPAFFGSLAVIASLPMFYFFMQWAGARGVALALSLGAGFQVVLLFELWNRKSRNFQGRKVYRFFIKLGLISAGMGGILQAAYLLMRQILPPVTRTGALALCFFMGLLFLFLFVSAGNLFHIREIQLLFEKLKKRFTGNVPAPPLTR